MNSSLSGCSWLAPEAGGQCFSCGLTRTRSNDDDAKGLSQFIVAERAKRQLITELDALDLPIITRAEDSDKGLAPDLLSSVHENVVIGHADGIITIDLAESDNSYRERMRAQLDEPYRTMLGHFRHEVGRSFEEVLVFNNDGRTRAAREFGLIADTSETLPFRALVETQWLPLSIALNQVNRSMGREDLYPFVLPAPVLDKLEFVHGLRG